MKKNLMALCIMASMMAYMPAQKLELVQKIPFDDYFAVAEKWDPEEGPIPGPRGMFFENEGTFVIYFWANRKVCKYRFDFDKGLTQYKKYQFGNERLVSISNRVFANGYFMGNLKYNSFIEILNGTKSDSSSIYKIKDDIAVYNMLYLTDGKFFVETKDEKLAYFEFDDNGGYILHGTEETEKLVQENREEYGYHYDALNHYHIFGDNSVKGVLGFYFWAIYDKLTYLHEAEFPNETLSCKSFIGTDRKGLSYYYVDRDDDSKEDTSLENRWYVVVAVLDPWHKQVTFRKIPTGEWTPMETENGNGVDMGGFTKTVSPSGDIYMFDGNRKEQCYQLKRLRNDWWQELGVADVTVGQVTTNHVALRNEPSEKSEYNGYNYENDYVQVLETKGDWSRVHKLDGREGWMESKYIVYE